MSDVQTEVVRDGQMPAAVLAKPRVSADHFRNLSARLKSRTVAVPDVVPGPVTAAPIVFAGPVVAAPVVVAPVTPVVAVPVVDVVLPVAPARVSPDFDPPTEVEVAPVVRARVSPDFDPPAEVEVAPVVRARVSPDFDPPTEVEVAPVVHAKATPDFDPPPAFEVVQETAEPEPVVIEVTPALDRAEVDGLPKVSGGFTDNFTYVPGPGEVPPILEEDKGISSEELAEQAIQLELENIWRMLLAKPTADDRAQYLSEAAALGHELEELEPIAPELDLSRIEPAAVAPVAENVSLDASATPEDPVAGSTQDLPELMRSLLDIMAAGNAAGQPQERALAADTLLRLVPRLDLKSLVLLAGRLSMMDNPPHLLVARLIRDPRVEVAGPLLEDCPQLSDKDLESVMQENEPAKLRMMARRRNLTRPISDLLIKSGDPSVVLTLVRNMECEISHDGFQSLLVLSEQNPDLLAPLATRADLQAPVAFELFWVAPPQLRRFILSRFLTDSEMLTKILKITMATKTEEEGELEPMSQHALIEGLERAARGHVEVAAEELANIMHVSPSTMTRILGDVQGEAIVVMLKAAGYPRSAVSGLLTKMQDADLPLLSRERDVAELQMMFETLSFNKARTLLTYWDWAQSKTGPYAPVQ